MLSARAEGGAAFTDEEIYGNVLTMLLPGEDTTANSLAWMMPENLSVMFHERGVEQLLS